jgi:molecular chaperone DnaK
VTYDPIALGDDFDQRVIDWICEEFKRDQGIDLRQDRMALQRLKEAGEKAKIELSTVMETEINLPFITADASGPKHLQMTLSRAKLEQLTADLIERSIGPCRRAMEDAGLSASDIDEVILVGGMTRMPAIVEAVRQLFNKEPYKGVNPDEVVGLGAAVQAGVLVGDVKDVLLLDVTPLTLSIETLGGVATSLIDRNTTIPTRKAQIFSTAADMQSQVEIHVVQGERPMARDNKSLGRFILDGIPPAPRGVPQIEVEFDIDANGILNVKAVDKATGRDAHITITASSGLSEDEIQGMVKDAEQHAEEDRQHKDEVEARNTADQAVYTAEKTLRDMGEQVPEDVRQDVEAKAEALKQIKDTGSVEEIRQKTEELGYAIQQIGAAAYEQQGGPGTPPPGGPDMGGDDTPPPDEDVVDGEFSEA